MKGSKVSHMLGIVKAPNTRRPKCRDVYLLDLNDYTVPGPRKPKLKERRIAKQGG